MKPSITVSAVSFSLVAAILLQHLSAAEPLTLSNHGQRSTWFGENSEAAFDLYRWLHQHPEVSLYETETAAKLAEQWSAVGLTVTTEVGGTGLVGLLKNGDGPVVMLRTDLDALPVEEATGLDYASKNPGVMHACGHDIHMTTVTTVARYLATHLDQWSGTLMLIGQPAEERGLGAVAMLKDGLLKRFPRPDYGLAVHVDGSVPTGSVVIAGGAVGASADSVDITVKGRGGHGSAPHTTIDPVVQAADLIMSLQTIVSREVKPTNAAVVTVGSIVGGTKHNIISDQCKLQLTVRSHSEEVRQQLIDAICRRAKGIAIAYGAPEPVVIESEGVPALANDEALADRLGSLFRRLLGADHVQAKERSMGFEDFSQFGNAGIPITMFGVGSVSQERLDQYRKQGGIPSLHSATYYPDAEDTLRTAFQMLTAAALDLFENDPLADRANP